jgi:hypothetical protein
VQFTSKSAMSKAISNGVTMTLLHKLPIVLVHNWHSIGVRRPSRGPYVVYKLNWKRLIILPDAGLQKRDMSAMIDFSLRLLPNA